MYYFFFKHSYDNNKENTKNEFSDIVFMATLIFSRLPPKFVVGISSA